jgi:ribosomal protein L37AE/L43A
MKPRCPQCQSKMVYLRLSIDEFVCRSCGNTWKKMIDVKVVRDFAANS